MPRKPLTPTGVIRRKNFAGGGLTDDERARMAEHVRLWTDRAFRTEPIDSNAIVPAIHGLYRAAKLKQPKVIIVPSPIVMAVSSMFAAAILQRRKHAAATREQTGNWPRAIRRAVGTC